MYKEDLPIWPEREKELINDAIRQVLSLFGNTIRAIYVLGSLAYGDYREGKSDIDVDVVIKDGADGRDVWKSIKRLKHRINSDSPVDVCLRGYTIPFLLSDEFPLKGRKHIRRIMLKSSAKLIWGEEVASAIAFPTHNEILAEARSTILRLSDSLKGGIMGCSVAAELDASCLAARCLNTGYTRQVNSKLHCLAWAVDTFGDELTPGDVSHLGRCQGILSQRTVQEEVPSTIVEQEACCNWVLRSLALLAQIFPVPIASEPSPQ
jgi:predicted nucleotidyltransferase